MEKRVIKDLNIVLVGALIIALYRFNIMASEMITLEMNTDVSTFYSNFLYLDFITNGNVELRLYNFYIPFLLIYIAIFNIKWKSKPIYDGSKRAYKLITIYNLFVGISTSLYFTMFRATIDHTDFIYEGVASSVYAITLLDVDRMYNIYNMMLPISIVIFGATTFFYLRIK